MKCPHCGKLDVNPKHEIASRNVEFYGSNRFVFRCTKCKKKYSSCFRVIIRHEPATKEDVKADLSFGG